jgi:arsenate reductase
MAPAAVGANTFAGIAPASVPGFVVGPAHRGETALLVLRTLYPGITPTEAAEVVVEG